MMDFFLAFFLWRSSVKKHFMFLVLGLLIACGPLFAHHGYQVAYDTSSPLTKTGTVTHLQWTNPHCQVYFDVKEKNGKTVNWGIEMTNPRALIRRGVNPALFPEGRVLEITFSPSRSGANRGLVKEIKIDGKVVLGGPGAAA
jgi:hypothetical protein